MDTSKKRREGDSKRLRETTETMETNGDAHQCTKKNKRQWGTDRDQGDWRDCEDQWICTQVKKNGKRDSWKLRET